MTNTQASTTAEGPIRVGVVAGSTRPTRRSLAIAEWIAQSETDSRFSLEVIDLLDHELPMLCEPLAAVFGDYKHQATRSWSSMIEAFDAFVLVVPEYNSSFPAVLKNALDHLYVEWHGKPVGLAGYGMSGGYLAVGALRPVVAELRMHPVPTSLHLSPHQVDAGVYTPGEGEVDARDVMIAEVTTIAAALVAAR